MRISPIADRHYQAKSILEVKIFTSWKSLFDLVSRTRW